MAKLDQDIFLIVAVRTPIGKFGGGLSPLTAAQLGTESAKATIARSGIDAKAIDEVIFGNARQAGVGPNVARQIAIKSGLHHEVPAYTVPASGATRRTRRLVDCSRHEGSARRRL